MPNHHQDTSDGIEPVLSIAEARTILGISEPTMARLLREDKIPTFYIGRRRLIDPADLRAFIDARRAE